MRKQTFLELFQTGGQIFAGKHALIIQSSDSLQKSIIKIRLFSNEYIHQPLITLNKGAKNIIIYLCSKKTIFSKKGLGRTHGPTLAQPFCKGVRDVFEIDVFCNNVEHKTCRVPVRPERKRVISGTNVRHFLDKCRSFPVDLG